MRYPREAIVLISPLEDGFLQVQVMGDDNKPLPLPLLAYTNEWGRPYTQIPDLLSALQGLLQVLGPQVGTLGCALNHTVVLV